MILAKVTFGHHRQHDKNELEDLAQSYLADLARNGQSCGDYLSAWSGGCFSAQLLLAGRTAMLTRHHSQYGKASLKEVSKAFGQPPVWSMDDDAAATPLSMWKDAPFLYLFTNALDVASPVCRGDGQPPIPVYTIPLPYNQKEDLRCWQGSYQHHDNIWLLSGALEIPAYRQLASPGSQLSENGRELCRAIESATGIPTFYYLMRYWGRARGESTRPCPGCGQPWSCDTPNDSASSRFWHFNFKCEPCRLVAHAGVATGGGKHVKIGEYSNVTSRK